MKPLNKHRISMSVAVFLSLLRSNGHGADTPSLKTVRVNSSEEVNKWKLRFESLAEFKFAIDRKTETNGAAVRSEDTSIFGALVESKKSGKMQLVWAVFSPSGIGFSGYGVFVDSEGKRLEQISLGPDRDDGQRNLTMARVEFVGKDAKGNEMREWQDREITAYYTTMERRPASAVALIVQFSLSTKGKQTPVEFILALPPEK